MCRTGKQGKRGNLWAVVHGPVNRSAPREPGERAQSLLAADAAIII